MSNNLINGKYKKETNFSIVDDNSNVWLGELPFKQGSKFPTAAIQSRADIGKTNYLLYKNSIDDIYSSFLNVLPEIDVIYGWQIRELISRLPYYRNNVENWTGVIASILPSIEFDADEGVEQALSKVIGKSNINTIITDEVRSRFLYGFSCYRVSKVDGKAFIDNIPSKNVILFVNKEHLGMIEVVVVFNIYKSDKGSDVCEFIEYHNNGLIRKRCFNYSNGTLGREIKELYDEGKAFEDYDISPIVIFRHNNIDNTDVYGSDQFRYWDSSIIGAMRAFQNLLRTGEKVREMIRKVPENAIMKDNVSGATMFMNRGNISYSEGAEHSPDIAYIQPDFGMVDAAIKVFESAMKSVSVDSGLGSVFFDIEKAGSNLSAKSIEAMLYPTKLKSNLIKSEMTENLTELIRKICLVGSGVLIESSNINVRWFNTFPRDEKEYTDSIMSRVNAKIPTLSQADAIILLDNVSSYTAIKRVKELREEQDKLNSLTNLKLEKTSEEIVESEVENVNNGVDAISVGETEGTNDNSNIHTENEGDNINNNDLLWETEKLPF